MAWKKSLLGVVGILLAIATPLKGSVIQGESSADFIDVGLNLDLLTGVGGGIVLNADIGNIAPASGTAPSAYDVTTPVLDVNVVGGVSTGVVTTAGVTAETVTSNASSNVDGLPGSRMAQATHTIEDFDLSIADLPLLAPDLISITADAISVSSAVMGDFGSILTEGTLDVTNLRIFVSGVEVGTALNGSIAPNTEIGLNTIVGDAMLILNQQILTGDGVNTTGLTTNAINLELTDVGVTGVGTLNGGVLVGPTAASLALAPAAVPEPSSWILLGMVGLGCVLLQLRSRRRAIAGGIATA